jgi:hypothetical protein
MDSPYTPTIRPEEIRQSFEFTNVSKGGKTYTVTITASCVVWDYPGTCRPKVVKFARLFEASPEHFVSLDGSEQRRETA